MAPDFDLAVPDGSRIKLLEFPRPGGLAQQMAVWLTRLPRGDTESPEAVFGLQRQGLVVLGVNNADDRKIALAYLKENQVTFPIALDTSEAAIRAMMQYETLGMSAVPMTYVIDREGKVVEAWYGYDEGQTERALKKVEL